MRTQIYLIFLLSVFCIFGSDGLTNQRALTLRGRVTFSGDANALEPGSKLTVELQDTSLADAPARVISRFNGRAIRFPIAFALKYFSSNANNAFRYSMSARIVNAKNELLYINDMHISVTLVGADRTKFIDVPVISVKQPTAPVATKTQWPELVGMNGQEAVRIIKQQTGFVNVIIVPEGSPVTLDYREDRVRVFVDTKGNVKGVPTIG